MKHYRLKDLQQTKTGFTDLFVLKAADLTVTTDDLLQNIALCTLQKGDVVYDKTTAHIKTEFTPDPSANATVTLSVGRTGTGYTDMLAASNLINSGTQIAVDVAYAAAAGVAHQVIASDDTVVYAQFDINDADGDLATITAGEVWVWMAISRAADRDIQA
jgi:hypothetical protein